MPGTLAPYPYTGFDNNGDPLSGGLLYTYAAGTSTPLATYSDAALLTPNSNPIVLDSAGRADIFLSATSYKFLLKSSAGVTIRTSDNIQAVNAGSVSGLGEIFVLGGDFNSPITAAAYPVGATLDKIHKGSAVFNIDSANLAAGTYKLECMIVSVSGATITAAIMDMDSGAPDTPLATCASASTTPVRVQSTAITFAVSGSAKNYAIKVKSSAGTGGYVWACKLARTA